jgi:hypothetical protein
MMPEPGGAEARDGRGVVGTGPRLAGLIEADISKGDFALANPLPLAQTFTTGNPAIHGRHGKWVVPRQVKPVNSKIARLNSLLNNKRNNKSMPFFHSDQQSSPAHNVENFSKTGKPGANISLINILLSSQIQTFDPLPRIALLYPHLPVTDRALNRTRPKYSCAGTVHVDSPRTMDYCYTGKINTGPTRVVECGL